MARRKNADFTGSALHGGGDGARELVNAFYYHINRKIPGSTPVPIPPPDSVHPKHDKDSQLFIFIDYAARKIAPIALDAAGLRPEAAKLRKLSKIVDRKTAQAAARAGRALQDYARNVVSGGAGDDAIYTAAQATYAAFLCIQGGVDFEGPARGAADVAFYAAELNPDATWAAVNEMLAEL